MTLRSLRRRGIVVFALLAILAASLALVNNNFSIAPLSRAEFLKRLNVAMTASTDWIVAAAEGSEAIPETPTVLLDNPFLMHMVSDSARLSHNERLESLVALYFRVHTDPTAWGRLIDPACRCSRPVSDRDKTDDYFRWTLSAVAPNEYALSADDRANMFAPDKFRTGHATHQLFALYFDRLHNGSTPDRDRLIRHISLRIASEAAIDFRVTDLYLQRIAFLLAAGQQDLVKRRWVERALAAQQPDGGWLFTWHGWEPRPYRFGFPEESSTSHPTAQGLWMVYVLKYRYPEWIDRNYR